MDWSSANERVNEREMPLCTSQLLYCCGSVSLTQQRSTAHTLRAKAVRALFFLSKFYVLRLCCTHLDVLCIKRRWTVAYSAPPSSSSKKRRGVAWQAETRLSILHTLSLQKHRQSKVKVSCTAAATAAESQQHGRAKYWLISGDQVITVLPKATLSWQDWHFSFIFGTWK